MKFTAAEKISAIHPLWFVSGYLLAIPLFGLFYCLCASHGFYAPYGRYDPGSVADHERLTEDLRKAIARAFALEPKVSTANPSWRIDLTSVRIANLKSEAGEDLEFTVSLSAQSLGSYQRGRTITEVYAAPPINAWSADITIPASPSESKFGGREVRTYRIPSVKSISPLSPLAEQNETIVLAAFKPRYWAAGKIEPALELTWDEEQDLQRYLAGIRGDASEITGRSLRMVYVSSVVITTLGLGDIVPVTPTARALVAIEAVVGVMTAGLFLNALAFRASRPKDSS